MNQNHIAFVNGVDKHGAKPPKGFPLRFAVLTWFEHQGGMADPWPLLKLAFPQIRALVGADNVMTEYWLPQRKGILFRRFEDTKIVEVAWDGLMCSNNEELLKQTFPDRFRFLDHGREVLVAQSEMWNLGGGPEPYHDSVTISFFSLVSMHEQLQKIFTEVAATLGASVGKTTNAEQVGGCDGEKPRS